MALRGNPIGHLYPGLTAEALPTPKLLTMAHHDVHVSGYGGITDKRNRQVGICTVHTRRPNRIGTVNTTYFYLAPLCVYPIMPSSNEFPTII